MRIRWLALILGLFLFGLPSEVMAQARRGRGRTTHRADAGAAAATSGDDGGAASAGESGDASAAGTGSSGDTTGSTGAAPGGTTTGSGTGGAPGTADNGVGASPSLATGDGGAGMAADSGEMTGEQYVVRLRDLEQRINELKEEIFRSKARLSLLAESVLQNVVGGARAVIVHENEMGPSFRLMRAVYALDGAPILTRNDDNGSLADLHDFPVYNGQIGAGDHTLTVNLEYQGNGYGIFSYVKGYTFRVRSTQSFSVPDGKAIQIRVVGYEKGGPTTPPEDRPAVRYVQRIASLREVATEEQAADSANGQNASQPAAGSSGSSQGESTGGNAQPQGGAGNNP